MLRKYIDKDVDIEMIGCDQCGQGTGADSSKENLARFKKEHRVCKRKQHPRLSQLKKEKAFKG